MQWIRKWAGLGIWLAATAFSPTQAATITVEAVGKVTVCADDGTLAGLAGGPCVAARVSLTHTFEVGSNTVLNDPMNPPLSSFGDAISSEILFLDSLGLLTNNTVAGLGLGQMTLQTAALPGTPASFSSSASQTLSAGMTLLTQMRFSGSAALINSADPTVAVLDLSSLPMDFDISFGANLLVALNPNEPFDLTELWSFTASGADVESIRFVREPGPLPEPASVALLLLALAAAALGSRRRNPPASDQ